MAWYVWMREAGAVLRGVVFLYILVAQVNYGFHNPLLDVKVDREKGVTKKNVDAGTRGMQSFNYNWLQYRDLINALLRQQPLKKNVRIINIFSCKSFAACCLIPYAQPVFEKYSSLREADSCTLGIVHEVHSSSIISMQSADYLIYFNWLQQLVAEKLYGIKKPHIVLPRLPVPVDFYAYLNKPWQEREKAIYVGGVLYKSKSDKLLEKLDALMQRFDHNEDTKGYRIRAYFVASEGDINNLVTTINSMSVLRERVEFVKPANTISHVGMFENMSACRYSFVWRSEPTVQEVLDAVEQRDANFMETFSVGESSMLSSAQAVGCKVVTEERKCIRFLPLFEEVPLFTFKDFAYVLAQSIINVAG